MHRYLDILSFRILSYDLLTVIGNVVFLVYFYRVLRRRDVSRARFAVFALAVSAAQFFGAMVIPFLYRWIHHQHMPSLRVWVDSPGRYFHSAFLSGLLAFLLVSKAFRWPTKKLLDHFIIAALMWSCVGRLGCFLQGCCGGKPTDLFFGIRFPQRPTVAVHPTQIYMFVGEAALVLFLLWFERRRGRDGETFWLGVLLYSIYRTGIEFFRTNPVFVWGLTHAQVFSLLTLVLSAWVLAAGRRGATPGAR